MSARRKRWAKVVDALSDTFYLLVWPVTMYASITVGVWLES